MAYLKQEVQDKIVKEIETLLYNSQREVRQNKYEIKRLATKQAILKRSAQRYNDMVRLIKG